MNLLYVRHYTFSVRLFLHIYFRTSNDINQRLIKIPKSNTKGSMLLLIDEFEIKNRKKINVVREETFLNINFMSIRPIIKVNNKEKKNSRIKSQKLLLLFFPIQCVYLMSYRTDVKHQVTITPACRKSLTSFTRNKEVC